MKLYLIRHAHATFGMPDDERPLSSGGREQARRAADLLRGVGGIAAREFWHSGLLRARETADILAEGLGGLDVYQADGLRPEDDPEEIALRMIQAGRPVGVVGHLPHLGHLASLLILGSRDRDIVEFSKCGILCLSGAPGLSCGRWSVQWFLTPALLHPTD